MFRLAEKKSAKYINNTDIQFNKENERQYFSRATDILSVSMMTFYCQKVGQVALRSGADIHVPP